MSKNSEFRWYILNQVISGHRGDGGKAGACLKLEKRAPKG